MTISSTISMAVSAASHTTSGRLLFAVTSSATRNSWVLIVVANAQTKPSRVNVAVTKDQKRTY
jgi:hypothetical protein